MTPQLCPQCYGVTDTATGKCTRCSFPLDKDPELYAVCYGCQEWTLIADLTEDGDDAGAWYCDKCLEERKERRGTMGDDEARLIESERRYDAEKDDILTEGGRS